MKLRLMASDKVCDGKIVERQQSIYLKYKKTPENSGVLWFNLRDVVKLTLHLYRHAHLYDASRFHLKVLA